MYIERQYSFRKKKSWINRDLSPLLSRKTSAQPTHFSWSQTFSLAECLVQKCKYFPFHIHNCLPFLVSSGPARNLTAQALPLCIVVLCPSQHGQAMAEKQTSSCLRIITGQWLSLQHFRQVVLGIVWPRAGKGKLAHPHWGVRQQGRW